MALQDASCWLRTAPAEARIATTSLTDIAAAVAAAASHALSMPFEYMPISLKNSLFTDADVHLFNYETVLSIVGSAGGIATIDRTTSRVSPPSSHRTWRLLRRVSQLTRTQRRRLIEP